MRDGIVTVLALLNVGQSMAKDVGRCWKGSDTNEAVVERHGAGLCTGFGLEFAKVAVM